MKHCAKCGKKKTLKEFKKGRKKGKHVIQVNVDLIEFAAMNYAALLEHIPIAASMITKEEYIKIFCEVHMRTVRFM
jgi:hypothetical protein